MTQIVNSYAAQWAHQRNKAAGGKGWKRNPTYKCGPVKVTKYQNGRPVETKVILRFDKDGRPIE